MLRGGTCAPRIRQRAPGKSAGEDRRARADPCFQSIGAAAGVNNIYDRITPCNAGTHPPGKNTHNPQHGARGRGCLQSTRLLRAQAARHESRQVIHAIPLSGGVHGESRLKERGQPSLCIRPATGNAIPHNKWMGYRHTREECVREWSHERSAGRISMGLFRERLASQPGSRTLVDDDESEKRERTVSDMDAMYLRKRR